MTIRTRRIHIVLLTPRATGVINNVGAYDRFYNGYCVGGLNTQGTRVFDKTGKIVLSVEDLGSWGAFMGHYSDGLLAYEGYLGSDYFVGWINLQGQPVITLYSGDASSYKRDENLSFGTTTFSEGYAFVKDGRGGRSYPAFYHDRHQGQRNSDH